MTSDIELSVIIPVYNLEKYISRCLDSILDQEIENMEVIVVDAGSTDHTREKIKEYASKYTQIRPIYSDKRLNASAARNRALDIHKGTFFVFCDADDTIPKGAYKEFLQMADRDNADIVVGNYSRRYRDGIRNRAVYSNPIAVYRCFENNNLSACTKLFRSAFATNIRFAEDICTAEDALYCMTLYRMHPTVSYTDKDVYIYTIEKEEEKENEKHKNLYSPYNSLKDCLEVLRRAFGTPFERWNDLWAKLYTEYLGFVFNGIWQSITNVNEKKKGYEELTETLKWLQQKNPACDFSQNHMEMTFYNNFKLDYVTFFSIDYSQYIFALLIMNKQFPPLPAPDIIGTFINMCYSGQIGMRTIQRAMKGWLHYKIKRGRS